MARPLLLVALASLSVSLAACSGGTTFFGDGGVAPDDGGGSGDGGGPRDGGGSGDGGVTSTKGGWIYLSSWDYTISSTPVQGGSASASFYGSTGGGGSSCTQSTVSTCTVTACQTGGGDAGASATSASAGTISVTGGAKTIQLVPSGTSYPPVSGQQRLWFGGEKLNVSATGADAPAFDLSVTAPSYVTVTAPSFPSGGKVLVNRAANLGVSWSGGGAGNVSVTIATSVSGGSTSVACTFPASSGSASVPSAALTKLPSAPTTASISVMSLGEATTNVSGWSMHVTAYGLARTSAGVASAQATIE